MPHFGMSAPLSRGRIHPAKERRDVCATPGFSTLRHRPERSDGEQVFEVEREVGKTGNDERLPFLEVF
jgi:hypothetical protein